MKTLVTEEQLREGIRRMAGEIQKHYEGRPLTIVGVLIGSVVLLADLIRLLSMPLRAEMVQARSDPRQRPWPGPLAIDEDLLSFAVRGRDVLLVDDIFHTGRTLWELIPQIDDLGASQRPQRRAVGKAGPEPGGDEARLRGLPDSQRVRRRLRAGFSRPLPQSALRGGARARRN